MKFFNTLVIAAIALGIGLVGCSKDEDVAELERQVMEQQGQVDTTPETAPDTLAPSATTASPDTTEPVPSAGAIPEEEVILDELPEAPVGSGFAVQIAGCEDADYASYLVERYRRRGYEPWVATETIAGQTYYRVRLGIFGTYFEAQKVKLEIADKYSIEPWIDTVD